MARHYPSLDVNVLGVNERGHESGNELATTDRSLPLLQDVDINNDQSSDVWESWDANWRNVRVVDRSNDLQFVVNLLMYPLEDPDDPQADPTNFNNLKNVLIGIGKQTPTSPYQAEVEPLDVDESSEIAPLDALLIINQLGKFGDDGVLPPPSSENAPADKIDPSGDGKAAPFDALLVINHLNKFNSNSARSALSAGAGGSEVSEAELRKPVALAALPAQKLTAWRPLRHETAVDSIFAGPAAETDAIYSLA